MLRERLYTPGRSRGKLAMVMVVAVGCGLVGAGLFSARSAGPSAAATTTATAAPPGLPAGQPPPPGRAFTTQPVSFEGRSANEAFALRARLVLDLDRNAATLAVMLPADEHGMAAAFYVADSYRAMMERLLNESRPQWPPAAASATFEPSGEVILYSKTPLDAADQSVLSRTFQGSGLLATIRPATADCE